MNYLELFRYAMVGAVSFLFDFGILMSFYTIWGQYMSYGLYMATTLGFLGGIVLNTYLSAHFVFLGDGESGTSYHGDLHDYVSILIIGVVGLGITELGMFVGVELMDIYYLSVKIIVTAFVFLWNYWARRKFVFYRECS